MSEKPKNTVRNGSGQFAKGNSGKPVGAKSERTKQWEALHESIVGSHAEKFNKLLDSLYLRALEDDDDAMEMYMNNYVKLLEYFKPKQARTVMIGEENAPPVQIVVKSNL
jgi:hypothetical protein